MFVQAKVLKNKAEQNAHIKSCKLKILVHPTKKYKKIDMRNKSDLFYPRNKNGEHKKSKSKSGQFLNTFTQVSFIMFKNIIKYKKKV